MDTDPREAARDRRARRFAAAAAIINTVTAVTGLVLGTCVLLLMWPYVLAGAGVLTSFVLLITAGAIGQLLTADAIWRRLQGERSELGRLVLASAIFSGVIGIPALAWTWHLGAFIVRNGNFWGYEWVAAAATAVLCTPVFSGLAGLIAFWRYHRVYAAMAAVDPPAPPRVRRTVMGTLAGALCAVVGASWLWPGGPPPVPDIAAGDRPLAEQITRLQFGEPGADAQIASAGRPAVEALTDRLAVPHGFRWVVAEWMGNLIDLGGNVARPLNGVRVARLTPPQLRHVANALPPEERYWLAEVMATRLPQVRDPAAREALVWIMSFGRSDGVPWLLNVIDTAPELRAEAVQALLWALPRRGEANPEPATPELLAELDRRAADASLPDGPRCDLAGTLVRLAPPGELRDRWIAWFGAELQRRAAEHDTQPLAYLLRGLGRCSTNGAPLADQLAALPELSASLTITEPANAAGTATMTYPVQGVWVLRSLAPAHPAINPAIQAVLQGPDHHAHASALYVLSTDPGRVAAGGLRPLLVASLTDGDQGCFQQAMRALAVVDGDIAAAVPALQMHWGAAGGNVLQLMHDLRQFGAQAAPALPFLRSRRGAVGPWEHDLLSLIGEIEAAVAAAGPRPRGEGK